MPNLGTVAPRSGADPRPSGPDPFPLLSSRPVIASPSEVAARLRQYLAEGVLTEQAARGLGDDDRLISTGMLSSIAVLGVVAFLEDEYHVRFASHEVSAETMDTLAAMAALVASKQGSG